MSKTYKELEEENIKLRAELNRIYSLPTLNQAQANANFTLLLAKLAKTNQSLAKKLLENWGKIINSL